MIASDGSYVEQLQSRKEMSVADVKSFAKEKGVEEVGCEEKRY
jgi:hypothetical protein